MDEDEVDMTLVRGRTIRPIWCFSGRVVQIIALVKPFRAQSVLAALESVRHFGRHCSRGDGVRTSERPLTSVSGQRIQLVILAQGRD